MYTCKCLYTHKSFASVNIKTLRTKQSKSLYLLQNKGVNSISSENTQVIEEKYYVDGEEVNNTVSLGEDLRKFYEKFGYPLYKEKKIPEDAEILNISYPAGTCMTNCHVNTINIPYIIHYLKLKVWVFFLK